MNIEDLKYVQQCYKCGLLYLDYDYENKITTSEIVCTKCKDIK